MLMVNPGHLRAEDKRGEATMAILDINNRDVDVEIVNMREEIKSQASFQL